MSHHILRRFFIERTDCTSSYEDAFRQMNVASSVVQIDHTMKVNSRAKVHVLPLFFWGVTAHSKPCVYERLPFLEFSSLET